jgi:H+-transporting ATPase
MTLSKADLKSLDGVEQIDYMPFDPVVKRTEGTVKENGNIFKVSYIPKPQRTFMRLVDV